MKKFLGAGFVCAIFFFFSVLPVGAREGSISLSNDAAACEGVSVWRESTYVITGRCQGLVYPYETQLDHYALWAQLENGNSVRIDDVKSGYFEGSVSDSFTTVVMTAEDSSSPRRPGNVTIMSGSIEPFAFETSDGTTVAPTPTPAPNGGMTVQTPDAAPSGTGVTVGSVIGRIMRALLVIVGVIIVVAVIASLIFRRRGSVSA